MASSDAAWKLGCTFGGMGVFLGAFGAHALKKLLSADADALRKVSNWTTATSYLFVHSLALLGVSLKQKQGTKSVTPLLFATGIVCFSGSIYLLSLVKSPRIIKVLGPITPIGGLFLIAGWISALNE